MKEREPGNEGMVWEGGELDGERLVFCYKSPWHCVTFKRVYWGARVAQLVEHPTSAQVIISWFVGLSPALGSVLTAQSLEPALDSVPPSLCPSPAHALSISLSVKNK